MIENQEHQSFTPSNDANIINLRLDTDKLINALKNYLLGLEDFIEVMPDGSRVLKKQETGFALTNKRGYQQLLNYVSGLMNPSVVQGNYTKDHYHDHVFRIHTELTSLLTCYYNEWGINPSDREAIIGFIMNLTEPYLSRLVDNKERESYFKTLEATSKVESKGGLFK